MNILAAFVKIFLGNRIKVILTEHICIKTFLKENFSIKQVLIFTVMKVIYRFSDAIITMSKKSEQELRSVIGPRPPIHVIYNPVIPENIDSLANKKPNHPWFHSSSKIVVSVGRLVDVKGFDILIKAFSKVCKKVDSKLIIYGSGPEESKLNKLIRSLDMEKYIVLAGYTNNAYSAIKHADLFAMSSRVEGFSSVVVEAVHLNTPIAISDCPGSGAELFSTLKSARVFPVNDIEKCTKSIIDLLSTNESHDTKSATINFTGEVATNNYLKVADSLMGKLT